MMQKNRLEVATVCLCRLFQQRAVLARLALMSRGCTITHSRIWMCQAGLSTSFQLSVFVIGVWRGTVNRFWNPRVKLQSIQYCKMKFH